MKNLILAFTFVVSLPCFSQAPTSPNIFIITTDGFRWQEIFKGPDSLIINDPKYVTDTALLKQMYWHNDINERRKLLMPFVWGTIRQKGALYGNRAFANKVSVSNPYRFSYAGYNEIFTGYADPAVITNRKKWNTNNNLLDFLNDQPEYKNNVAAFTSWNLFEYILNGPQTDIYLNSGYKTIDHDSLTNAEVIINAMQQNIMNKAEATRNDMLTFVTAKEYIQKNHPKVVYIGFGETDEHAHAGSYAGYLQSAHLFDEFIAQLWYLVNTDPFYRNNTSFIITTDHGRGHRSNTWVRHGLFTPGSDATWLMTLGPLFKPAGEVRSKAEILNEQLAQTIAGLLGFNFTAKQPIAEQVTFIR